MHLPLSKCTLFQQCVRPGCQLQFFSCPCEEDWVQLGSAPPSVPPGRGGEHTVLNNTFTPKRPGPAEIHDGNTWHLSEQQKSTSYQCFSLSLFRICDVTITGWRFNRNHIETRFLNLICYLFCFYSDKDILFDLCQPFEKISAIQKKYRQICKQYIDLLLRSQSLWASEHQLKHYFVHRVNYTIITKSVTRVIYSYFFPNWI